MPGIACEDCVKPKRYNVLALALIIGIAASLGAILAGGPYCRPHVYPPGCDASDPELTRLMQR
jgi:hypothetical protein